MMARKGQGSDPDKELREAFKVFDRDGTGTISRDELKAVMKSLGENLSEEEIDEMLKLADKDGDGHIDCEFRPPGSILCYSMMKGPLLTSVLPSTQTRSLPRSWRTSRGEASAFFFIGSWSKSCGSLSYM